MKVVDLVTLYNFQEGYRGFFSTDFELHSCQL
jgi:hypothetical protein